MKIPLTGEQYKSVYEAMFVLINKIENNDYHSAKLKGASTKYCIRWTVSQILAAFSLY